jgi:rod shape-determining protein MreC
VILSILIFVADYRYKALDSVRNVISISLTPVQLVSRIPSALSDWFSMTMVNRKDLLDKIDSMQARMLLLERKAQQLAALSAENDRLRELLNASSTVHDKVLITELIGVSPNPNKLEMIVDKGKNDGVKEGMAVLDSSGLMGQVVQVSEFTSRVLLIADTNHAVPVQVNRNAVRAIAYGTGRLDELELANVLDTADIKVGDLLVSSGLGGRFPKGYPVARVTNIVRDPGRSFARVTAVPMAKLNQSRLLLIVLPGHKRPALPNKVLTEQNKSLNLKHSTKKRVH